MIHTFKRFGLNIILDVPSGSIFTVNDVAFEVILFYNQYGSFENIYKNLTNFDRREVDEAIEEVKNLINEGVLFTQDNYAELNLIEKREPVIKSLCLHVAHDCDLRCKYCFASTGSFKQERNLMPVEVGRQAIDFLLKNSGRRKNLEVDFFGGEPLLNFEVVKKVVEYAREEEKKYGKSIAFTITTNATKLNDETIEWLNENMENVVLSHDGRPETHNFMRIDKDGNGTYERITPKILKFVGIRKDKTYCVRGTFTSRNLDFSEDVVHLANLGIKEISIEPAVLDEKNPYAIKPEHLEKIKVEYDKLAEEYIKRKVERRGFNFFHFNIDLSGGPCVSKRLCGCGAGFEYVAVDPVGDIYPCHQFVDKPHFKLGNVFDGITKADLVEEFKRNNIYEKEECSKCWARFYCSGGCAAANYNMNGDLKKPYSIGCELEKRRVENAIAAKLYLLQKGINE
jgi:uncharacterized protein